MSLAPPIDFPLEEILRRVVAIQKGSKIISTAAIELQRRVRVTDAISDEDERLLMKNCDMEIGNMLIDMIESYFPNDSISCAEFQDRDSSELYRWVVDPIDGAMNFIRGLPLFAISIGIQHREKNVAGIVILPALGDVYIATLGGAATKNGEKLQVSKTDSLANAVLVFSFPTQRKNILNELITDLTAIATYGRSIRRTGSVVLDLCWLAEGMIDGLWDKSISHYDSSATSVILKEAGGSITDFEGKAFVTGQSEIVASNTSIHKPLVRALSQSTLNRN